MDQPVRMHRRITNRITSRNRSAASSRFGFAISMTNFKVSVRENMTAAKLAIIPSLRARGRNSAFPTQSEPAGSLCDREWPVQLLVIAQRGHHIVQLLKRDEPAAMSQLVLVNGRGQLVDFRTSGFAGILELTPFATRRIVGRSTTTINERECWCRRLLLDGGLHYSALRDEEPTSNRRSPPPGRNQFPPSLADPPPDRDDLPDLTSLRFRTRSSPDRHDPHNPSPPSDLSTP